MNVPHWKSTEIAIINLRVSYLKTLKKAIPSLIPTEGKREGQRESYIQGTVTYTFNYRCNYWHSHFKQCNIFIWMNRH